MPNSTCDKEAVAISLNLALKHLRARLREESSMSSIGLSMSQISILQGLHLTGSATAASLAAAEHVSQQAIAQNIVALKSSGLVQSNPDPQDGRKALISMTGKGHRLRESVIASRTSWLARAIDSTLHAEDRAALSKAVELLERLADAKL